MPRKPENPGTCADCGEVITKRSVSKHLDTCPKRFESLQSAAASSRPVETLWQLRVQDTIVANPLVGRLLTLHGACYGDAGRGQAGLIFAHGYSYAYQMPGINRFVVRMYWQ